MTGVKSEPPPPGWAPPAMRALQRAVDEMLRVVSAKKAAETLRWAADQLDPPDPPKEKGRPGGTSLPLAVAAFSLIRRKETPAEIARQLLAMHGQVPIPSFHPQSEEALAKQIGRLRKDAGKTREERAAFFTRVLDKKDGTSSGQPPDK